MPDELPPAAWYPDPAGGRSLRYWNGAVWTDHVHTPPVVLQHEWAGFGRRVVGYLVDAAVFLIFSSVLTLIFVSTEGSAWADIAQALAGGVLMFLYQWISISTWNATPGMRLLNISVRYVSGDPHGAVLRRAAIFGVVIAGGGLAGAGLVGLVLGLGVALAFDIGCLMMLGNAEGRTWHDRLSGTQIVDNRIVAGTRPDGRALGLTDSARKLIIAAIVLGIMLFLVASTVSAISNWDAFTNQPDTWDELIDMYSR